MTQTLKNLVIAIKGAGEMASGIAWRLHHCGIRNIVMLERAMPLAVRRTVCFCEAVHCGQATVEGLTATLAKSPDQITRAWHENRIAVTIDPQWQTLQALNPDVVVDATIAKRNLGTQIIEAPLVIGVGPGFEAGRDVHLVVETNRGHHLGRVLTTGCAQKNTGIPGPIQGITQDRVLRAPGHGTFHAACRIGMPVTPGQTIATVGNTPIKTKIPGIIRGLIRNRTQVSQGLKIGDIDPRGTPGLCHTISDKARAIAGGVLEAVLRTAA